MTATAIASLPHADATEVDDAEHVAGAVARLFLAGVELDTRRVHAGETRRRVSVPTYPFARTRHWLTPPTTAPAVADAIASEATPAPSAETGDENTDPASRILDGGPHAVRRGCWCDVGPDDDHRRSWKWDSTRCC